MAVYFKELPGINPLTINQADMVESTQNELTLIPQNMVNSFKKLDKAVDFHGINKLKSSSKDRRDGEMKLRN